MTLRLKAALQGDLQKMMQKEFEAVTDGIHKATKETSTYAKGLVRTQVRSAGLPRNIQKTVRSTFYPNKRYNAAAFVHFKAPKIIEAFDKGVRIQAKSGHYLAIPTKKTRRLRSRRNRRNKLTMKQFIEEYKAENLFIHTSKNGNKLLVSPKQRRITKTPIRINKNKGTVKRRKRRKLTKPFNVHFVLIKSHKFPKKLNLRKAANRSLEELRRNILKYYK